MQPRRKSIVFALYLNAALLAAVSLLVLWNHSSSLSFAAPALGQTQAPIAGGSGLFVVPAQFSTTSWGCYLLDVSAQNLCAYQYFPGDRKLHLIAARNFKYDMQLQDFNTQPSPDEIRDLVKKSHEPTAAPAGTSQPAIDNGTQNTQQ